MGGIGSHLTTALTSTPSTNSDGTTLTHDSKKIMDVETENIQYFEHPSTSTEKAASTMNQIARTVSQTSGDGSPLNSKMEFPEHLPCPSNNLPVCVFCTDDNILYVMIMYKLFKYCENI